MCNRPTARMPTMWLSVWNHEPEKASFSSRLAQRVTNSAAALPSGDSMYSTSSSTIGAFYRAPLEEDVLDKEGYSGFLPEVPGPRSPHEMLHSAEVLTEMWREPPPPPVWTIDDVAPAGVLSHSAAESPPWNRPRHTITDGVLAAPADEPGETEPDVLHNCGGLRAPGPEFSACA